MKETAGTCHRCGVALLASIVSRFNTDTICIPCSDDEHDVPGYARAEATERAAILLGDYNFSGVGLSGEDRAFLDARRKARAGHNPNPLEGSQG